MSENPKNPFFKNDGSIIERSSYIKTQKSTTHTRQPSHEHLKNKILESQIQDQLSNSPDRVY